MQMAHSIIHWLDTRVILEKHTSQGIVAVASEQLVQMVKLFFSGYMGDDLVSRLTVIRMLHGLFSVLGCAFLQRSVVGS